jgi:hypothetical protein
LVLVASLFIWFLWARKQTYEMNQYKRQDADTLCRQFSVVGLRKASAGINRLVYEFLEAFKSKFSVCLV